MRRGKQSRLLNWMGRLACLLTLIHRVHLVQSKVSVLRRMIRPSERTRGHGGHRPRSTLKAVDTPTSCVACPKTDSSLTICACGLVYGT